MGDPSLAVTVPPAQQGITINKSVALETDVAPAGYSRNDTVKYTVTLTNTSSPAVEIIVDSITDVLPAYLTMANPAFSGSQVTAANSSSLPAVGATGTVVWIGKDLGIDPDASYRVPASGTLTRKSARPGGTRPRIS